MKLILNQNKFDKVLDKETNLDRGEEYLSYVEDQIRHDSWQNFHDDVFAITATARRLYLTLCFDIGVRGDGFDGAFSFYGYDGDAIINEIREGFKLIDLPEVDTIIEQSYDYWKDPGSPMHSDSVPWMRMDQDLDDVHGRYYKYADDIFSLVGELVKDLGREGVHEVGI